MNRNQAAGMFRWYPASLLSAICLISASTQLAAQTVDAPPNVCTGNPFQVTWTGPNAPGDRITIASSQAAYDEFIDAVATADGNPAVLAAPAIPGTYAIRYTREQTPNVLVQEVLVVESCGISSGGSQGPAGSTVSSGSTDSPAGMPAQATDSLEGASDVMDNEGNWRPVAVEVRGTQVDYGNQIDRSDRTPYGRAGYTIDQLCEGSDEVGMTLQMISDQVELDMLEAGSPVSLDDIERLPGAPNREDIKEDMRNARDLICNEPPRRTTVQPFVITYAYCRMAMYTPTHAMDIHLPPGGGNGTMSMADHGAREVVVATLRRTLNATSGVLGSGWTDGLTMKETGAEGERIGYPVRQYTFESSSAVGTGAVGAALPGSAVKVRNSGTLWASPDVIGAPIVQAFYERLTREVQPNGGAMSFFGGLINNMAGMLRYGIPLEIDQTSSSSIMGIKRVSGRSKNYITGVRLVDFYPEWCNESLMPTSYAVTDIDKELSDAIGGAGGVDGAMADYNESLEKMSPADRALLEGMGVGNMVESQMRAAGGMDDSPTALAGPTSADLTTDNLLQSVQLHLEALGISPGNTDGEASLQTAIAISQFQAEKGLEVTGEASPVLLGVLAAEVDSRP
jgi:hypothetical protein